MVGSPERRLVVRRHMPFGLMVSREARGHKREDVRMHEPCHDCKGSGAIRMKQIRMSSGKWFSLAGEIPLCRACVQKRREHAEAAIARQMMREANEA